MDSDAAGAGARCYCWFFLEILLFEGVLWTAHGVAPGKMKCTMLLMEEDSAMLLLELVHAATPGSSNCYCWSTCVSRACTSHAEINSRKEQAKKTA